MQENIGKLTILLVQTPRIYTPFGANIAENDKFRQKLVVFSYIRLTASYMHLRCVIFASQVICLRA